MSMPSDIYHILQSYILIWCVHISVALHWKSHEISHTQLNKTWKYNVRYTTENNSIVTKQRKPSHTYMISSCNYRYCICCNWRYCRCLRSPSYFQIKSNQIKFISHKYRNDIYTNTACIYLWAVNQKSRSLSSWLPWHGKKSTQKTPFNSIIIIIIFTININNNYNNCIINNQQFQPLLSTTPA